MANFARIENNSIIGVYENLPINRENISNFSVYADDEEVLNNFGWHKIQKITPDYNNETHSLGDAYHWIEHGKVYESYKIEEKTLNAENPTSFNVLTNDNFLFQSLGLRQGFGYSNNDPWDLVREERDRTILNFEWRYMRYAREIRLGITPTDDIQRMDAYIQALADITNQEDPNNIIWPTYEL